MKTKIEWATVPGAQRYQVSDDGQIIGPSGKVLKPMVSDSGHLYIFINKRRRYVHRLILEAFIGKCPPGRECRHLDGNPKNNKIDNLTWGTRQENVNDRWIHGTMPVPHESIFTKLKPSDIPEIIKLHNSGLSSRKISFKFNTSHTTIQKIIRGERWKGYV